MIQRGDIVLIHGLDGTTGLVLGVDRKARPDGLLYAVVTLGDRDADGFHPERLYATADLLRVGRIEDEDDRQDEHSHPGQLDLFNTSTADEPSIFTETALRT